LVQEPEQQNASSLQTSLVLPHTQAPLWQAPLQHSAPDAHRVSGVEQAQLPPGAAPEQHWDASSTRLPVGAQQVDPPPQMLPGSHCAPAVHGRPKDGLHA
jgi:hypothetical protein